MKAELLAGMPLHELRRTKDLSQRDIADRLKVNQPAIAKLKRRDDVYVSSLRSYIETMGRKLKVIGEVLEGEVAIANFPLVETLSKALRKDGHI